MFDHRLVHLGESECRVIWLVDFVMDDVIVRSGSEGESVFGDQFKMLGVETPMKQDVGGQVVGDPGEMVLELQASTPERKQMLLQLASSIGEDGGEGIFAEQEEHQAAYDAYGEQEVQVFCRGRRAPSNEFSRLERDNLGFYTERPTPEKQILDR